MPGRARSCGGTASTCTTPSVPYNRVGWASVVGDPETGNLYACGVDGLLVALDRAGKVVWQRSLTEEFGFYSGFGGRTHSPMIDEDRLVLSFTNTGWGEQGPPRTRTFAFDKRTGALQWVSTPGVQPYDLNTQTTPVVAVINGQRLLIEGGGDGWIYAIKARTGEKVWGFQLSKSGINTTVAVNGTTVYAAHSEENVDAGVMGRLVAIDATGTGDVTKTHELWRAEEMGAGFPSPIYHDGRLYVVDNSANLFALDAKTGKQLFKHKLGTVGKASPVWADGKLYIPETNGRFHILKPGPAGAENLDMDEISVTEGSGTPLCRDLRLSRRGLWPGLPLDRGRDLRAGRQGEALQGGEGQAGGARRGAGAEGCGPGGAPGGAGRGADQAGRDGSLHREGLRCQGPAGGGAGWSGMEPGRVDGEGGGRCPDGRGREGPGGQGGGEGRRAGGGGEGAGHSASAVERGLRGL